MKKVLFLTTALIATGSMAAAELRISGFGRFGLDYNENSPVTGDSETSITSRLRLQFDASAETDSGVTIGARLRIQSEERDGRGPNAATNSTGQINAPRFFASFGGFTVATGNILGAIDSMPGLYIPTTSVGTGIDGMGFNSLVTAYGGGIDGFSSTGEGATNAIEVIYSAGDFGAHLSYSDNELNLTNERIAGHLSYTFAGWTAAIGIQDADAANGDKTVFTLDGEIGPVRVGLAYAENDDANGANSDVDAVRIFGAFDVGAATRVVAWVADIDSDVATEDGTAYGIDVTHDLGGGVSFIAGIVEDAADNVQAQAGVRFTF